MDSINEGLALAERVEGYGEGAKGKRVEISADLLKQQPVSSQWALATCTFIVGKLLSQLGAISTTAGRRVAIFADDYDCPCVKALEQGESFEEMNEFFKQFYTTLKARSDFFPFLFITGTSRIRLVDFFDGANDITDLSFDAQAITALGYTWAEIERLYSEKLPLLERLHDVTRDELKAEMERWYGGYRWSKNLEVSVFNPLSVNELWNRGSFILTGRRLALRVSCSTSVCLTET
jgi:hypothetical protein